MVPPFRPPVIDISDTVAVCPVPGVILPKRRIR
jgi:hypothetical protein